MTKVGFLGSSFDPITNSHLAVAQEMANRMKFDKVFFMPSSFRRRDKTMNVHDIHRLEMVKLAIAGNEQFDIEDIEMNLTMGSEVYTYLTMRKLREKYPNDELFFLMGADLLVDIADGKWAHTEEFLSENQIVAIRRNGIDMHQVVASNKYLRKYENNIRYLYKGVDNEISSSYIREEFEMGGNPRYLMPEPVYHYIKENGLYIEGAE